MKGMASLQRPTHHTATQRNALMSQVLQSRPAGLGDHRVVLETLAR